MSAKRRHERWAKVQREIGIGIGIDEQETMRGVCCAAFARNTDRCAAVNDFAACMAIEELWYAVVDAPRLAWDDCARDYHKSFVLAERAERNARP